MIATLAPALGPDTDWSDDPAPENDPYGDPSWPPQTPSPEQRDVWEVRNGEKAHAFGLSRPLRNILKQENLELIQVYKGLFLVECALCKSQMTPDIAEEERSWSCDFCGRTKLDFYLTHDTPATLADLLGLAA